MAKNIMLIFLSDVKTKIVDEKILVSETPYKNVAGETTHTTNESAIRYVLQNCLDGTQTLEKIFIFASKKIREDFIAGGKFLGDNGETMTHLKYFKARMKKFLPNVDTCITDETIYPFNEHGSGSQNLMSVAEMAGRIQNYAAQVDAEVTLHVDFSGGMRHVNMLMLDVIRLLEYSGIKIGKLLYSNFQTQYVEEVKDIYDLFQLIAGVEEFVQFGSVKALKKYYETYAENLSEPLKNLIRTMENFAEAIKLCHYDQFRKAIQNLHDAVNDFQAAPDNVQDVLMERLSGRIRKDYQSLIKTRELDDLRVIRWCIDNGYMQQALTLYTERVPEYIGYEKSRQINFVEVPPDEEAEINRILTNDNRNFNFYLLNNYKENDAELFNANDALIEITKCYSNLLKKDAMIAINKRKFDIDAWLAKVKALSNKPYIKISDEQTLRRQLELLVELKENPSPLLELSSEILNPIKPIIDNLRGELEKIPAESKRYKKILEYIGQTKAHELKKYFPVFELTISGPVLRLATMIDTGIFSTTIPTEKFLRIMDKYFRLKHERNQSNHARVYDGEFSEAGLLKEFIEQGLDEIEAAKKFLEDKAV